MDTTSLLVILSLILLGYLYLRRRKLHANLPPGPWSVPIFGSLPFLGKDLRKEALRMSKEFNSDLITISLGQQLCILLNSFDSIKAVLSGEDFLDRPNIVFFLSLNKKGIGSADGQLWKEHRRLSLSVLRDMGMGKMAAEEKIEEEIHQLIDEIGKKGGRSFEIGPLLTMATANIILATLVGQRYDYEDPEFLYFVTRFKENLALLPNESLLSIFPSLRHIPGDLFNYATIKKNIRSAQGFAVKHINEHKKRFDPDNIADFLDAYIAEKEKQDKKDPNNTFTGKHLRMEAMQMSKEFNSDLITISLGQQLMLCYVMLDRPNIVFFLYLNKKGIGSADGQLWKEHRRLSLSVLRDMGMGKMAAEEKIEEEIHQLIDEIGKKGGRSFEIGPLLSMATANIILAILAGQRYDYEDPEVLYFVTRFKENLTLMPSESLLSIFPSLRHIPGDLFDYATIKKNVRAMQGFAVKHINEHKKRFDPDNIADFLDAYIAEKEKQDKKDPNNTFTDEQLKNVIFELFGAGSDTTATTLEWAILLMVTHPEIQRKIQFRDVSFQNFTILKGTIMMPNIWAVHRDPKIWKNPDAFDPSNFLDDKGGVVRKPELIPFAIGRRQCPGEGLSKMEIFLVLVALLQRFTFTKPEGAAPPSLEGVFGVTNVPAPFEMCVRPRSTG
ncbi:cytochrome P450 2C3-like isoform X1 [Lineus longissimus]|uniref:cytochrome P450 2C3-like isoform X1 n=1 Tax=Lineus longissimus TaxID=88925 RepID=UPI002B4F6AA5